MGRGGVEGRREGPAASEGQRVEERRGHSGRNKEQGTRTGCSTTVGDLVMDTPDERDWLGGAGQVRLKTETELAGPQRAGIAWSAATRAWAGGSSGQAHLPVSCEREDPVCRHLPHLTTWALGNWLPVPAADAYRRCFVQRPCAEADAVDKDRGTGLTALANDGLSTSPPRRPA